MVTGAPSPWTISPQSCGQGGFDPAAPQLLSGLGPGGPVIYGSDLNGPGVKERLVRRLLASLPGQKPDGPSGPVSLEVTVLGQPRLTLGGQPGPAVSFSQAAGRLWAALSSAGQVGVDAALPEEFEADYPMARAFQPGELDWARALSGNDTARAAALLWTLKEAAVKALGVGFHLLDPLALEVFDPSPWQGGIRVSIKAGGLLSAWARPQDGGWLAIARNY
jgi:phosphopantetheinyl transferase